MTLIAPSARRSLLPLGLLLALPLTAEAQPNRASMIQKMDSTGGSFIQEGRAAGLAIAVVKGNDTLLLKGYGKADVEWGIPMPADAMFEIGSVAKQFTAAAILQLRDEGKLSLEDELTKYFPDFPTHGNKVTLRRLLDHTSGIKGITEMREFGPLSVTSYPKDSAIALIKRYPFEFTTGDAQIYNNSAFILLGHIIEKTSGMTYEDYVEKKIFAPLGMTRSMYCNSSEVVERRAHGYIVSPSGVRRAPMNVHTWPYSAGSICSTAPDLVKWLQALHGGKVLSQKSYTEMITPSKLNDGTPLRYSMGLGVGTDIRGFRYIGHGGGISGFVSEAIWYPDAQLAVVVLINSNGNVSPSAVAGELAAEVMPWTRPTPKAFTGDATPLLGRYSGPSRGQTMTVEITQAPQGISIVVNGQSRPLSWIDGWSFRQGNTLVTLKRPGSSGNATELRFDTGGGHYVLKRTN